MIYLLPVLAYLIGSISTAVLIARLLGMPDPRTVGSGNPGATNILRQGRKMAAAVTLLGDVLKGVVPVLIARLITSDPIILALVALAAFLGHLYPVFFKFRGGKGVATAFGIYLALNPWIGLALVITWGAAALYFRYSSLAAVITAVVSPVYIWWLLPGAEYLIMALVLAVLLTGRHRGNIWRLVKGGEDKIKLSR